MTAVLRGYYCLFSSRPVPSPIHNLWKNLRMIPALFDFRLISHLTTPGGVTCFLFLFQLFEPVQDHLGPGSAGTCLNTSSEYWLRTYYPPEVPDCLLTDISSPQQPYEIGIWISPFYRWRNWLREITCFSARSWKEQNWPVNRDLTGLKARGLGPRGCTASSNYAAFSHPLKGCKEEIARTIVQFMFDMSLSFLVWFLKKRRKVFE